MATMNATKKEKVCNSPDIASWTSGSLLTDEASPVLCVPSLPVQQLVRSK